ncbi:hypothetical protein J437_LFUL000416, partial [Ladona fulva]
LQVTNHGVGVKKNKEYVGESIDKVFRTSSKDESKLTARSLLVDTENKVLENILCGDAERGWCYDRNNVVKGHGGSANNWAFGHYSKGPEVLDKFMDLLRKEIEHCDHISLLLGLLSSAGGTGSGLGSFIAEAVRDEYPRQTLANVLNIQNANLSDLNSFGVQQLASIFQGKHDVSELLTELTPHPGYKCLTLDSSPKIPLGSLKYEGIIGWEGLVKDAIRSMKTRRSTEFKDNKVASVSNAIITRGPRSTELLIM